MGTTAKSKSSSAKVKRAPFTSRVLARARELAPRYSYLVRYESKDDGFAARPIELPNVVGFGKTPANATREAVALAETTVAFMIEQGAEPPTPGIESPRTEQVNFRLSVEEKARLEAAARRKGLTLVDYIRGSALAGGAA